MSESNEEVKSTALVVDLDALDLQTAPEEVNIDPNADPFSSPPPPPDGTHRFKLFSGKEWKMGTTKNNVAFISTQITAKCIADGESYNNMVAFDRVNTLVFEGKSYMAGILKACKVEVPTSISFDKLAILFRDTLATEPTVRCRGRWKAQEKNPSPSGPKDQYVTVQAGMRNFPPVKDGEGKAIPGKFNHVVEGPKSKETVSAKFEIQEYLVDG